jgi:hypothetical protein
MDSHADWPSLDSLAVRTSDFDSENLGSSPSLSFHFLFPHLRVNSIAANSLFRLFCIQVKSLTNRSRTKCSTYSTSIKFNSEVSDGGCPSGVVNGDLESGVYNLLHEVFTYEQPDLGNKRHS